MGAQIIDGKKIAELVRAEWKVRADKLIQLCTQPGLSFQALIFAMWMDMQDNERLYK